MEKLENWLDGVVQDPKNSARDAEIEVILNTFQTVFGRIYWGKAGKKELLNNKQNNELGVQYIRSMKGIYFFYQYFA